MILELFLMSLTTVVLLVLFGFYSLLAGCMKNDHVVEKFADAACEVVKASVRPSGNNHQQQQQQPKKSCKTCNSSNHFTHECYHACGNCGEMGHTAQDCRNPKERKNPPSFVHGHFRHNGHGHN